MSASPKLRGVLLGAGVLAGFSTRIGGNSEAPFHSLNVALTVGDDPELVRANRSAFASTIGAHREHLIWGEQPHGGQVAVLTDPSEAADQSGDRPIEGVDALVTSVAGRVLCIRVADCLPVLLADAEAGIIGAAHAGRRGLVAGVLANTVAAMESIGAGRARIRAVIGPAVCGRCYEVPEALAAEFDAAVPGTRAVTSTGTPSLDLPLAGRLLLEQSGVGSVESPGDCTAEQPDLWYSYRRSARTGRFAGFVVLS
ncbi:MAG: peptidoglycan editing factor PgeF [Actinomycetota bacterium]